MPNKQSSASVREEANDLATTATQSVKDCENQQDNKVVSQDTSANVTKKAPDTSANVTKKAPGSEAVTLKQIPDTDPGVRETARSNGTKRPFGAILDENGPETTTTTVTTTTIKDATGAGDGAGDGPERKKKKKRRAKVTAAEDQGDAA